MLPLWIIDLNRDENLHLQFKQKIDSIPGASENWRYTTYKDINFDDENWFVDFVQELVSSGQQALRELKTIKPINDCCMNICVLGDTTQEYTLKFFSTTAAIIKKEKLRIIPGHIHQGINILGMLYVPSDIHNADFSKRQSVLRCLKELDVQHRVNLAAGYDRVMLYQDTQRRTAKVYPLLTEEQRMDYILQCIIHLYYVCDSTHPLLDGNSSDDFFFSLGVGSLYYDTDEQDEKDIRLIGNEIIDALKEKGTVEDKDHGISLFDLRMLSTSKLFENLRITFNEPPSMASLGVTPPVKHPVSDYSDKHLIALFYKAYLKYYPTNLLNKIVENIADSTKNFLENINTRMNDYYCQVSGILRDNIHKILRNSISPEVGCFQLLKNKLTALKEAIVRHRNTVEEDTEVELWAEIITKNVPQRLNDAFMDYHAAFTQDERNTGASHCDQMKEEVTEKYVNMLKKEPTLLSVLVRSFLVGIIVVLAFMPIIEAMSPTIINLGNVKDWSFVWAFILFLIPLVIEFIIWSRREKKKRKLVDRLVAYYLHDSYARLVNRAKNNIYDFYDKLVSLCSEYDKRCDTIIAEKEVIDETHVYKLEIPKTMFNQPVIDGECCGTPLFPDSEMNRNMLNIHGSTMRVDRVSKKHKYVLVQDFAGLFMQLFDGVKVYEGISRDPETNQIIVMNEVQMQQDREKVWEDVKAKFHRDLVEQIKTVFVPRNDTTISQKLNVLAASHENQAGFKLFASFCTANGEFIANDDKEFADIKTNNLAMREAFSRHLPLYTTACQVNEDPMYRSFLFLTKWRTFEHITPSRILPETELFDKDVFDIWNKPPKSSLILYALLGNMSPQWYELFTPRALVEVPEACKIYKDEVERRK